MPTFAFIHDESKNKIKHKWLSKYIKHNGMLDIVKIVGLFVVLMFVITIYLYYVTQASTRGYFLRQANNNYNKIKSEYEIVKTTLLNHKQANREKIHNSRYANDVVKIQTEVVHVPSAELTRR